MRALEREGEHEFVRHEAAEAIGAIEGDWERSEAVLRRFMEVDHDLIVRQSCEVALDGADYFRLYTEKASEDAGHDEKEEREEGGVTKNLKFAEVKGTVGLPTPAACSDASRKVVAFHFNVKD